MMFVITVLGFITAALAVVFGQLLEGGTLTTLLQPASFFIVVGGTIGAVLVHSTPTAAYEAVAMLRKLLGEEPQITANEIDRWCQFAKIRSTEGIVALEKEVAKIKDPFSRKILLLLSDNHTASFVKERLTVEVAIRDAQHKAAARVWEAAAGYAPTIGILGSVIGLLQVVQNLQDTTGLGAGIAVAFTATVYGLMLANMLCMPIAHKLKAIIATETLVDEMRVEAASLLCTDASASMIRERLLAFKQGLA